MNHDEQLEWLRGQGKMGYISPIEHPSGDARHRASWHPNGNRVVYSETGYSRVVAVNRLFTRIKGTLFDIIICRDDDG